MKVHKCWEGEKGQNTYHRRKSSDTIRTVTAEVTWGSARQWEWAGQSQPTALLQYSREANLLCIDGGVGEPNTLLPVHSRKTVHEVWNAWNSRWNITWRWFVAWSWELDGVSAGACRWDAHWSVMYHRPLWLSLSLVVGTALQEPAVYTVCLPWLWGWPSDRLKI